MATTNMTITPAEGWALAASTKCTIQVVQAASYALYNRAASAPSSDSMSGFVLKECDTINNAHDTPQNSYVRAVGHDVSICVITQ